MAAQDVPDLYGILGIPSSASNDELRDAYRQIAKENHPDRLRDLPEEVRDQRTEMMYEANEAYDILSNPEKRKKYDSLRREAQAVKEGVLTGKIFEGRSFEDLINELFGEDSPFYQRTRERTQFSIPENDLGLLAALVEAHKAEGDGKWRIKKSDKEARKWVPDEIYSVIRREGQIIVYRRIDDWRKEKDRTTPIGIRKEGGYDIEREIPPNHFVGEYYLAGRGRDLMENGIWVIPKAYAVHLAALKRLAKKLAEGNSSISPELAMINRYGTDPFNKVRLEGNKVWDDPDNELARTIRIQELSAVIKDAEDRVVSVEGSKKGKESQEPQLPERQKPKIPEGNFPATGEVEGGTNRI